MVSRGNDAEDLLSVKPVAARFSVSIDTVRRWTDAGLLPAERTVGKHRRCRAAMVDFDREMARYAAVIHDSANPVAPAATAAGHETGIPSPPTPLRT
ncbi:MerR family DNA-binding transcriptional regulator [Cellulomonas septica]|uniref:MerR family DNA-binding transcriptional regulator n=1 Tax=Cellulomonas septica TaxID=285080 RepID=A0ABX1JY64_9CELL|nr:MerR family DNA-binding transcriptional regulator [Cellulomonas septica]